ncbi:MAG TPA: NADPH cytochrome P450 oxidoreductase family protein, partial [Saprospiraceae bacterium]|nr:NADPH cytochrome P450 oxidoreductase family protein [Saprospiraceae bacterium]
IRDGHSILSKLFVLPIIIIALSGVYLSIYRFFPPNPSKVTSTQVISTSDILALKLKDIVKVSFALDEEESTIIQLGDKTIFVSYDEKSFTVKPNQWSTNFQKINFILHTGEGTVYWSLILLTTSIVILILCLSGFAMVYALTKKKKIITSPSEFNGHKVILVGSEMGSTWRFAYALKKAFETKGEKIAIFGLDQMPFLSGEKQLFILTSTYGDGDPPENAKKAFANITCKLTLADKVQFAVLGFGSREYPEFCAFAEKLRDTMCLLPNTTEILPYSTVDRQSIFQFLGWIKLVNSTLYYDLTIPVEELQPVKRKNLDTFTIIEKKQVGETFTLTLSHQCFIWINSGDLIAVYPPDENVERYYSIAVLGKNKLLLVIKKTGKCSNYLGNLQVGDNFFGFIKQNLHFHLPQEFSRSLLIANGTGIAPFLGMMQNDNTTLYWGGRYHEDYDLFKEYLQNYTVQTIFSKETPIGYVQNLMAENPSAIIDLVKANGIIMICGSLTMLKGVLEILDQILSTNGLPNIIVLKSKKQILIDCY